MWGKPFFLLMLNFITGLSQLFSDLGNKEYYFKRKKSDNSHLSREEAVRECQKIGGHLADITSHNIFNFMERKLNYFQPPRKLKRNTLISIFLLL